MFLERRQTVGSKQIGRPPPPAAGGSDHGNVLQPINSKLIGLLFVPIF